MSLLPRQHFERPRRLGGLWVLGLAPLTALVLVLGGCGRSSSSATSARPTIVVTYSVLGAVVRDAVGDLADVVVLIPNGSDPHEWEPSAKDIETVNKARLIVRNGLDLEGGLQDTLDTAQRDGVPTFVAAEHITVRIVGQGEGLPTGDPDQAVGAQDPHLWMDPLAVRDVLLALGPVLRQTGIDASVGIARVGEQLIALDAEVRSMLSVVADADRQLVTGHESFGYFADRYGFRLVGAIIPSLTSQAEVSSGDLAALATVIDSTGVRAIFTELGTPTKVAEAIGRETGVAVVGLASHILPADGSYSTFLTGDARTIAAALAP